MHEVVGLSSKVWNHVTMVVSGGFRRRLHGVIEWSIRYLSHIYYRGRMHEIVGSSSNVGSHVTMVVSRGFRRRLHGVIEGSVRYLGYISQEQGMGSLSFKIRM